MLNIGDKINGVINFNSRGSAHLINDDLPKDIYISKDNVNKSLHLDEVVVQIVGKSGKKIEGKVTSILNRDRVEFVGTLDVLDKYAFLIPHSKKIFTKFYIPLDNLNGGLDGQKVVVKLINWVNNNKSPKGEVIKVLGDSGDNNTEIHTILHEYGLPYDFDEDVIREANNYNLEIPEDVINNRKDMRDVLTFTIDPDTAKDFDDALSIEWINGEMHVGVHIADVTHYVEPDTLIDKEALKRGNSVYLVDRVVPMLPENLSNGVCSLRPKEDKLCLSAVFKLDHNGHILDEWFGRTVVNSNARLTYNDAQEFIESGEYSNKSTMNASTFGVDIIRSIRLLDKIAKKMRKSRLKRGSITFDKREVKFRLDDNNYPIGVEFTENKDANKLIEEFMLLANRRVAKFLKSKGPCVNRIHEAPDDDKLESLKTFIKPLGYDIKFSNPDEISKVLNKLLLDIKGTGEENIINNLTIRTMQKAYYGLENIGHYGLGFDNYTHFTAPIRRYSDVITHRLLIKRLEGKISDNIVKISERCEHLSQRESRSQRASRESIKYMQCIYMSDKVGKIYNGTIISITEYGMFIEMPEVGTEGMVKVSEINGDAFKSDLKKHRVIGYNTGEEIRLGDKVTVVVKSVDVDSRNIDLTLTKL